MDLLEAEDPLHLKRELGEIAEVVMCSLLNDGLIHWLPAGKLSRSAEQESLPARSPLQDGVLQALPAVADRPARIMEMYRMADDGDYYVPGPPGSSKYAAFVVLCGVPPADRIRQSDAIWRSLSLCCDAARDILFPANTSELAPEPVTHHAPAVVSVDLPAAVVDDVRLPATPAIPATAPASPIEPAPAVVEVIDASPAREMDHRDGRLVVPSLMFTPVAQLQGALLGRKSSAEIRAVTLDRVMDWLAGKQVIVPSDWNSRLSWESGTGGDARQAWYESDGTRVAVRFDEPCGEIHGRSWRVEFVLTEDSGRVLIGTRVSAMVQVGVTQVIRPTIPLWVRRLADNLAFAVDGRVQSARPALVRTDQDLRHLAELIGARGRSCAVVVAAIPNDHSRAWSMAEQLATRAAGFAHVFAITPGMLDSFREVLGRAGEIPQGGARLYPREIDLAVASVRCPVMPSARWQTVAGVAQMTEACAAQTVAVIDPENDLPSFAQIRQLIMRERRRHEREQTAHQSEHTHAEVRRLLDERETIERDIAAAEDLAREAEQRLSQTLDEMRSLQSQIMLRDQQITALKDRISTLGRGVVTVPDTWDGIEAWAAEHYANRLVLTPSAMKAARRSVFENLSFVCDVITFMAEKYWPMRAQGDEAARKAFVAAEEELRVEVSRVGEALNHHRLRGQYQTTWNRRTYDLDQHVSGSSSRDRRRGFRLYFGWDEALQMIVVGSLPDHLDNSLS